MGGLTGNKLIDTILLGLSFLASLACIGVFIYTDMIFKKELPQDAVEKVALEEDALKSSFPESFKLDKMTVNLKSRRNKLRYLDTTIHLVPFKAKDIEKLEDSKPQILDIIIDVSGKMEPEEINSVLGKILYEDRIKKGVNRLLHSKIVKDIYFSKFTVQ